MHPLTRASRPLEAPKRFRPPYPYAEGFRAPDPAVRLRTAAALADHASDEYSELVDTPGDRPLLVEMELLDLAYIYGLAVRQLAQLRDDPPPWSASQRRLMSDRLQAARSTAYEAMTVVRPAVRLRAAALDPALRAWRNRQALRGRTIDPWNLAFGAVALDHAFGAVNSDPMAPLRLGLPALPGLPPDPAESWSVPTAVLGDIDALLRRPRP